MAGSTGEVWMSANERNALSATCDQVSPPCIHRIWQASTAGTAGDGSFEVRERVA